MGTSKNSEINESGGNGERSAAQKGRGGAVAIVPRPPFSTKNGKTFDFSRVEFLIVRRSATVAAPGALCFPGGGIEPGEKPRDAVSREFLEEVGLDVEVGRFLGKRQTPTGAPLFWFAADARSDDPNVELRPQPEEVAAVEWRTLPSLLADADFLANNREIVRKIVDGEISLAESRRFKKSRE
ncbi:MAG: NUDIX hydrolase [Thermoguttaceae bacterium]|nr:NUDIX hydrolase [Thermoguttaceae bacterium]MBQ9799260.1 NUDIX hydrolase [Thermoguttaceae bacterium]